MIKNFAVPIKVETTTYRGEERTRLQTQSYSKVSSSRKSDWIFMKSVIAFADRGSWPFERFSAV